MHTSAKYYRMVLAQVKHPDETELSPPNLLVVDAGKGHGYGEEHHLIPYVEVVSLLCEHLDPRMCNPASQGTQGHTHQAWAGQV